MMAVVCVEASEPPLPGYYQYFRGVKCHAQGHNTAEVGFEPPTSRSGVGRSTTEPPHSPMAVVMRILVNTDNDNNVDYDSYNDTDNDLSCNAYISTNGDDDNDDDNDQS